MLSGGTHTVSPRAGVSEPFCGTAPACSVVFTNNGNFGYQCNFHGGLGMTGMVSVVSGPNLLPTVAITNLGADTVVTTPGTVTILAAVNDPDGMIVQTRLITNGIGMLTNTAPPFGTFVISNLPAIRLSVRVSARDNRGALVNSFTAIVRPAVPPLLTIAQGTNAPLQLQFNSATGINYVVEQASGLTGFAPVTTNLGSGGAIQFAATNLSTAQKFIRVRLQ
jgi:hypothetical protein